jgi:hypothetical protein
MVTVVKVAVPLAALVICTSLLIRECCVYDMANQLI